MLPAVPLPLIAAVVALAVGAGGAWKVQAWRWAAADAERVQQQAEATRMAEKRSGAAGLAYEPSRAAAAVERQIVYQEVERVIDRPVYRDRECLDADGVRIVNAASQQPAPASGPDAAVPGPAAAD